MAKKLSLYWIGCALALTGCAEETLSVGELRCAGTHCETPKATVTGVDERMLEESDAGQARIVWTAEQPSCGDDGCALVAGFGADAAQWVVHEDGSVTTASAFAYAPEDEPERLRSGVALARFSADGTLLAAENVLVHERARSPGRLEDAPVIALAADAADASGGLLLAVGAGDGSADLAAHTVSAELETEALFELRSGGAPLAVASAGEDLLIAGGYGGNTELGRYRRDGELRWRQTALVQTAQLGADRRLATIDDGSGSGTQLAVDAHGRSAVLVPGDSLFGLSQVDASGEVTAFMWLAWAGGPDVLKGQLAYDSQDRVVAAIDAYLVSRCGAAGCSDGEHLVVASREREEFYNADVLGMDLDAEERIYILTHAGDRSQHRVLLDRISADFTLRETFVVAEGDRLIDVETTSRTQAHEIQIGPQGDVYVWAPGLIGRIELP